ncbi:MAG: S8 family serine peptidase, partial [Bacteroidota bacterium]
MARSLAASSGREALESIRQHEQVLVAQLNHSNVRSRAVPNDPNYGFQWHFNNDGSNAPGPADIQAEAAWDISTGGLTTRGDTIVIAVIDGGIDLNHEDLQLFKNRAEIPNNGLDDDNNGYVDDYDGWNAFNSTGSVPNDGHGTNVSGIAGAKGNNNVGVTGINWDVQVLPIAGDAAIESIVLEAYGYVLEMRARYNETNGAEGAYIAVTNSSFGVDKKQPADFPLWCAFYDSLGAEGILSVGATTNQSTNVDVEGDIPTACTSDFLVAVTNTNSWDQIESNAGYGASSIDIGAPGVNIYTTFFGSNYGFTSGTSMSTPQVAGAIALMYSVICQTRFQQFENDPAGLAMWVR